MKSVRVINVCGRCGSQVVGRKGIEALVEGRERMYLPACMIRRCVYSCGSAVVYAAREEASPFARLACDDQHREKFVRCKCDVRLSDPMGVIREEYRESLREKFGGVMSAALLFSLPSQVVAWENCAAYCVDLDTAGMVFSEQGKSLIELVQDMSVAGVFGGEPKSITLTDCVSGFSYLHMIKSQYRAFVAADFGATAILEELFSAVPLEWFDWVGMFSLNAQQGVGGSVEVARDYAMPLTRMTRDALLMRMSGRSLHVPGSAVPSDGLWIKFMSGGKDSPGFEKQSDVSSVLLEDGQTFLPTGDLLLHGQNVAVTFEPGVQLVTQKGAVIDTSQKPLTVFLQGSVRVTLHTVGCQRFPGCKCVNDDSGAREFVVAVQVDSCAPDTRLYRRFSRTFDVLSTEARFMAATAEFVVISGGVDGARNVPVASRVEALRGDDGYHTDRCVVKFPLGGSVQRGIGLRGPCTVRGLDIDSNEWRINGIIMNPASAVGILGKVRLSVSGGAGFGLFEPGDAGFLLDYPVDDYVLDGGGPSASDGEFDDETVTYVKSHAMEALMAWKATHDFSSMKYLVCTNRPADMAHELGPCPRLDDLLQIHSSLIAVEKLHHLQIGCVNGFVRFGVGEVPGVGLRRLYECGRTWGLSTPYGGERFWDVLVRMYGDVGEASLPQKDSLCF